jgi:hypothetical protein
MNCAETMRRVGTGSAAVFTALMVACARQNAPLTTPDSGALPSISDVVAQAIPSVILLLNYRASGNVTFGAGLIVDREGRALTNLHVVEGGGRLGALLYQPGRVSYTPMDGGLGRFLFEHQDEIVTATLEQSDAVNDFALVRLKADTAKIAPLPLADAPPRIGDEVLSLGHPQETVWSFTQGVVSALPQGIIQHDALISPGSSGGPLLDRRGRVLGLNTAMVKAARWAGFARPASLFGTVLKHRTGDDDLDLSSPARAEETCLRAAERGSLSSFNCVDHEDLDLDHIGRDVFHRLALDRGHALTSLTLPSYLPLLFMAIRNGSILDEPLPLLRPCTPGETGWVCQSDRRSPLPPFFRPALERMRAEVAALPAAERARIQRDATRMRDDFLAMDRAWKVKLRAGTGLKIDRLAEFHGLLAMGYRVEESRTVGENLVWVRVAGRNRDGTAYQYSTCRRYNASFLQRRGWLECIPHKAELAVLPEGWPPPLRDGDYERASFAAALAAAWLEATEPAPKIRVRPRVARPASRPLRRLLGPDRASRPHPSTLDPRPSTCYAPLTRLTFAPSFCSFFSMRS